MEEAPSSLSSSSGCVLLGMGVLQGRWEMGKQTWTSSCLGSGEAGSQPLAEWSQLPEQGETSFGHSSLAFLHRLYGSPGKKEHGGL